MAADDGEGTGKRQLWTGRQVLLFRMAAILCRQGRAAAPHLVKPYLVSRPWLAAAGTATSHGMFQT